MKSATFVKQQCFSLVKKVLYYISQNIFFKKVLTSTWGLCLHKC